MRNRLLHTTIFVCLLLTGCASSNGLETQKNAQSSATNVTSTQATLIENQTVVKETQDDDRDPFESVNRAIWDFNYNILDKYLIRPMAVGYKNYMPSFARTGLLNAANNLEEPSSAINNMLQAKPAEALTSTGRFLINSTVGVLGLIDVSSHIGLQDKREEFGEVLGKWGVSTGPYLMLPAMGPNDARNLSGDFVDSAYFPLNDLTLWVSAFRVGVKALEGRIRLMDQEQLLEDSMDPYLFVKEAYFQRVKYDLYDGNVPQPKVSQQEEEDFEAFLDDMK
ncbi:MlaA family lipoprotein [Catenovulum sediminis]|uniref:MlaA family lipoprotein n=1 Tax=Catenovulum sediminis TaxID=1740262 RepID=UPI00117EFC93|nr:VacJ family lipoprotein [Catenovulum sediminis]